MHLKRQPAIGLLTYQYTDKNPRLPRAFQNAFEPFTSRFGAGDHFETVRIAPDGQSCRDWKTRRPSESADDSRRATLDLNARSSQINKADSRATSEQTGMSIKIKGKL